MFIGVSDIDSTKWHKTQITIEDDAFAEADGITTITCQSATPKDISEKAFSDECYRQAKLMVPAGTISLYMSKTGWKNFKNVAEYKVTSIDRIKQSKDNTEIYDLQGRKVKNGKTDRKGIYVINRRKVNL